MKLPYPINQLSKGFQRIIIVVFYCWILFLLSITIFEFSRVLFGDEPINLYLFFQFILYFGIIPIVSFYVIFRIVYWIYLGFKEK
jgi:hypothetical protein